MYMGFRVSMVLQALGCVGFRLRGLGITGSRV